MEYDNTRGMTVHFMDGSRMRFVGPKQAKDDWKIKGSDSNGTYLVPKHLM